MKRRRSLFLIVLLIIQLNSCQLVSLGASQKPFPPKIHASAFCVLDGENGRVLWEKNSEKVLPNASTTKILTCILALENCKMDEDVTVSAYAAGMPRVHLGMKEGEKYHLEDLLYAMMLESFNDVAVAIAEHVSGSVEAFAEKMNDKAKSLGDEKVNFVTPNGLDAEGHGISAVNLARIMGYCVQASPQKEKFLKITGANSHSFQELTTGRSITVHNHNSMLGREGIYSGKTGFTGKAGYCYVAAAKIYGHTVCIALLASGWPPNKNFKWQDCRMLLKALSKQLAEKSFPEIPRGYVKVKNTAFMSKTALIPDSIKIRYKSILPKHRGILLFDGERIKTRIFLKKGMKLPVKKDQIIGEAHWYVDGNCVAIEPIFSVKNYEEISLLKVVNHCFKKFLLNRINLRNFPLKNCT